LPSRQNLRDDDDEARMQLFLCLELSEVAGIVRDEGEVAFDDAWHESTVGLTAQPSQLM
jgi:hypothetical protein